MGFPQIIYNPKQQSTTMVMGHTDVPDRTYHGPNIISSVNSAAQEAVANNLSWIALVESDAHFGVSGRSDLNDLISVDPMIGFIALHNPPSPESQEFSWEYSVLGNSKVLLAKMNILADMGTLDDNFTTVSFAILDLVLRANHFGYRCVRASLHIHQATRPDFNKKDWKLLRTKHPRLMTWLRRERQKKRSFHQIKPTPDLPIKIIHQPVRSIEFDLTNLRLHHDGTAEVACNVLKKFKEKFSAEFEVRIHAPEAVLRFHGLDFIDLSQGKSDCCLRFGQIQTSEELLLFMRRAPLLGGVFLDTVALDCMHLDKVNLQKLWNETFRILDFVAFISGFSQKQALLRFPDSIPQIQAAQLLSTSADEYRNSSTRRSIADSDYFFVVGNRFAHKDVHFITEKIASFTNRKVIALADKAGHSGNISYIQSGSVSSDEIQALYANASVVIFPSHYEGFGFPIMHALANRRPIVCRDLPVYREIIDHTAEGINVYPCRSRNDLIRLVVERPPVWLEPTQKISPVTWLDSAETLARTIRRAADRRRDDDMKKQIEKSIASQYSSFRRGKRMSRLVQSASKRMDALIAPHANLFGYL